MPADGSRDHAPAKCDDCGAELATEDDRYYLEPHGDGPLCLSCWSNYPSEDDPEFQAAQAAHAEANRRRWAEMYEVVNRG